jgi:hypothetical protein
MVVEARNHRIHEVFLFCPQLKLAYGIYSALAHYTHACTKARRNARGTRARQTCSTSVADTTWAQTKKKKRGRYFERSTSMAKWAAKSISSRQQSTRSNKSIHWFIDGQCQIRVESNLHVPFLLICHCHHWQCSACCTCTRCAWWSATLSCSMHSRASCQLGLACEQQAR